VADDDGHLLAGELFGDRTGLLGIAGVVADFKLELAPEHAARRVEIGDRLVGAVFHLPAEGRLAAGHRAGDGDGNVLRHCRRGEEAEEKHESTKPQLVHVWSP
jgi:hypothetical protein